MQLLTDPASRERIEAYIAAARPQVERAAFDILSYVVNALNEASTYQRAALEYAEGGLRLRIDESQDEEPETSFGDDDLERVTLRLPRGLKELIDSAAERHGISANNWYVRALSRAAARHLREALHEGHGEGRRGRRRGFYRGRGGGSRGFAENTGD